MVFAFESFIFISVNSSLFSVFNMKVSLNCCISRHGGTVLHIYILHIKSTGIRIPLGFHENSKTRVLGAGQMQSFYLRPAPSIHVFRYVNKVQ